MLIKIDPVFLDSVCKVLLLFLQLNEQFLFQAPDLVDYFL
jgi:hypothetical protein